MLSLSVFKGSIIVRFNRSEIIMGRKSNEKVRNYYEYNSTTDKSKCSVCNNELSGSHITNLKRHLEIKHIDILENDIIRNSLENNEVEKKKVKISFELNKEDFIDSVIKIVTKDGRPFKHLDGEGFREIVNPIFKGLGMLPISSSNVMEFVDTKLEQVKNEIVKVVKGRIVSLKIDCATRMDRLILGVNLQFIELKPNFINIAVRTLAMVQIDESHTGEIIKETILKILSDYSIDLNQIYR